MGDNLHHFIYDLGKLILPHAVTWSVFFRNTKMCLSLLFR